MYLLGDRNSKRSIFFDKAAAEQGLEVRHVGWDELYKGFDLKCFEGVVVKIDPPSYDTFSIKEAGDEICIYMEMLNRLEECNAIFLNTPASILQTLDKRTAKKILEKKGLPVTPVFMEHVSDVEHLLVEMRERRVFSVFIKPVVFSGAAGVAAFRLNQKLGRMKMYTSCKMHNGILINTKHLYALEDEREIVSLLDGIINLDVIVERWVPKDSFEGKSYDLRIVQQFGHDAAETARGSKGPITNLHLNNIAMPSENIWLRDGIKEKNIASDVKKLCVDAVSAFEGLSAAGVDVLIEKTTMKPRIIEINGQGDLLYNDIYGKNIIYGEQAAVCRRLERESGINGT